MKNSRAASNPAFHLLITAIAVALWLTACGTGSDSTVAAETSDVAADPVVESPVGSDGGDELAVPDGDRLDDEMSEDDISDGDRSEVDTSAGDSVDDGAMSEGDMSEDADPFDGDAPVVGESAASDGDVMFDEAGMDEEVAADIGVDAGSTDAAAAGADGSAGFDMDEDEPASTVSEAPPPRPEPTRAPVREPQSGLLTAGDIDDNLNLDYFADLVGNWQQDTGENVPYVELRDRITIDLVAANGVGIGNTTMTISDGEIAHAIVTNSAGRAQLYPTWLGLDVAQGLTVTSAGETWDIDADEFADGALVIDTTGDTTPPSQLDVALVLDVTGSMADELNYLTVEFESIVSRLDAEYRDADYRDADYRDADYRDADYRDADYRDVDMRFALIVYRDTGDAFVTRAFDFTDNVALMRGQLADQVASGGGDFPEAMDAALVDAEQLSWRSGADTARMLVLNADAPPHGEDVQAALETTRRLGQQGVRVYPLAASGVDRNAEFIMRAMAATTGGRHMFLTGDSGIGGAKLEPKAQCYLVTGLDDLLYRVMASELAGERVEPLREQIIRTVGQYNQGVCA